MNDYKTIADKPIPTYHIGPQGPIATLRDQFAMAALTGISAISQQGNWESKPNIAEWCYQMADAMMEARK